MTAQEENLRRHHFILVPGFWLGSWAWEKTAQRLRDSGHSTTSVTLPGLLPGYSHRSDILLSDHVAAISQCLSEAIAQSDGRPTVLVGHSGAGPLVYQAMDANPELVARIIYVDSGPMPDGVAVNAELAGDLGEIEFPSWEALEKSGSSTEGLTPELRELMQSRATPHPANPARTPITLTSSERYNVPATVITSSHPKDVVEKLISEGHPYFTELAKANPTIIELKTGHWPMLSEPDALADAIEEACLS